MFGFFITINIDIEVFSVQIVGNILIKTKMNNPRII